MEAENRNIIKAITELSITSQDKLGDIIAPILFKSDTCALYLSRKTNDIELLVPTNEKERSYEMFWLLTELISLLHELEFKHLIYVVRQNEDIFSEFYYQEKKDYKKTQINSEIKINDICVLRTEDNGLHAVYKNGSRILLGVVGPSAIYNDLMYFLNSIVYPTSGLKKYIKRGFKSEETYLSIRSNRISKISIFTAIFIAIISPVVSVWFNNLYGVSLIDETQYDGIIKSIEKCKDSIKSIYYNNQVNINQDYE